MTYLLDTHLLLWTAGRPHRLPAAALRLLENPDNEFAFSVASIWEIAIKARLYEEQGRGQDGEFSIDVGLLRRKLLENGYSEVGITSNHASAAATLPLIHKDPFDRLLVAQAEVEGMTLVTADETLANYHKPYLRVIRKV